MRKLSAGKYWIGDPCYVLDNREDNSTKGFDWDVFCSFCFDNDPSGRCNEGIIDHQGIKFAFYGTANGDGQYNDNEGNSYGVDAGCLACIPVESLKGVDLKLGHVHDFEYDFQTDYDEGLISFGHIEINTDFDEEDEDDENEFNEHYVEEYEDDGDNGDDE